MTTNNQRIIEIISKASEELRRGEQGYHIYPSDFPNHDSFDIQQTGFNLIRESYLVRGTIINDMESRGYITHITSEGFEFLEAVESNTFLHRLWKALQNSVIYVVEKFATPIFVAVIVVIIIALISFYWGIDF